MTETQLAEKYVALWNEPDANQRRRTIAELWTEDGRFELGAELDVELPSVTDPDKAVELVRTTHGICPYSNATRGNLDVAMSVNGVALEEEADVAIAA